MGADTFGIPVEAAADTAQVAPGTGEVEQVTDKVARVTISSTPAVAEAPAPEAPPPPAPVAPAISVEAATKQVTEAGLDMGQLAEEFSKEGKLTEETYTKLTEKGITRETVDSYIAGQQAIGEQYNATLAEAVGGADQLNELLEWAAGNLTPAEKTATNKVLQSMDAESAKLVLNGLQARHKAVAGSEPKLVNAAAAAPSPGVQPFRSWAEVTKAMNTKEYRSDPGFRAELDRRLAISDL